MQNNPPNGCGKNFNILNNNVPPCETPSINIFL